MSVKVMAHVWEHSQHKGSDLLTLLAIADHADDDGQAYPSIQRLAYKTRMTERNVQYVLKKLEQSNELTMHRNQGPHGCHLFLIRLDGVKNFHPENFAPLKTFQGEAHFTGGVKPISPEPSLEPSEKKNKKKEKTPLSPPKGTRTRALKFLLPESQAEQDTLKATILDDTLTAWCTKKGLTFDLDDQWDAFTRKALANGYKYTDWRLAFMNWLTSPYQNLATHAKARQGYNPNNDDFLKYVPKSLGGYQDDPR